MNYIKINSMEFRAIWSLSTVFALRMLGVFMVLPVLTIYGMDLKGANKALLGLAIGIHGLVQAILQIPLGILSDYLGRKPLIVSGLIFFAIGSALCAMTDNVFGMILGRAIQGLGSITAAVMALLSDLTNEENRTKAMAFIGISFGVIFAVAIILGPIVTNAIGLCGLFWGIAMLALAGIMITLLVVPNEKSHTLNRETSIIRSNLSAVLVNRQLLKINLGIFFLHAILMLSFIALPSMMTHAGFLPHNQWKVYLVTILISFAAITPIMVYAENNNKIKSVFIGFLVLMIASELTLLLSNYYNLWVIIGIQMFFLSFNFMEGILPSLISKASPASFKGTAMGIYSTSQFLGVALGGVLGGYLLQLQGSWTVFMTGTLIALVWLFVSITMNEPSYVRSLRLIIPKHIPIDSKVTSIIREQPGVTEVVIVPEERSVYIKVNNKQINIKSIEKTIFSESKQLN